MTNEPTYDKQLEIITQYVGFGGDKPLPGTSEPTDRLVRGAYYAPNLPDPADERQAIASLLSVMRNVGIPYEAPSAARQSTHPEATQALTRTIFRLIMNLDEGVIYFDRVLSPTVFWVRMDGFDFSEDAPVPAVADERQRPCLRRHRQVRPHGDLCVPSCHRGHPWRRPLSRGAGKLGSKPRWPVPDGRT
jgi:choloylglycine hydrolase